MEIYTLDSAFERVELFDEFESLIWTERWSEVGDFELHIKSTVASRTLLKEGTRLAMNRSSRVMTIETVEKKIVENRGGFISALVLKGRSLEMILEDRQARNTWTNLKDAPKWVLNQAPADMIRTMFTTVCLSGALDAKDKLPVAIINSPQSYNIPEPAGAIKMEFEPQSLYSAFKKVGDPYDLGFRLTRDHTSSQLFFETYPGDDRTSNQNLYPAVIFSTELENLIETTEFRSIGDYKNVAYVFSPRGSKMVYPLTVDPNEITAFNRRVLYVDANDVSDEALTAAQVDELLTQKGTQALSEHRTVAALDGQLAPKTPYVYGRDYDLGDLVEMQDEDGVVAQMRVTEQIFAQDAEGERIYPTLQMRQYVTPGSWLDWRFRDKKWPDMGATEYWATMP